MKSRFNATFESGGPRIVLHHFTNIRRFALLTCLILIAACQESPTQLPADGIEAQLAKGGNGKGKPKPGDEPPSYSIRDLGEVCCFDGGSTGVFLADIINSGIIAGAIDQQPILWDASLVPVSLPTPGSVIALDLSEGGVYLVGSHFDGSTSIPIRWKLDGTTALETTFLPSLYGALSPLVLDVNDFGKASVVISHGDQDLSQTAILWAADGTITPLPHLPGSHRAGGFTLNNSGHVVGKSFFDFQAGEWPHAVLWIPTDAGYRIVDLTPRADNTGDSHAFWVSEVSGGFITIAGRAAEPDGSGATFWKVDVGTGKVVDVFRFGGSGVWDVNVHGDFIDGSTTVRNWLGGATSTVPHLGRRFCAKSVTRHINDDGTIIGSSSVSVSKGRCRSHAVIWTKIVP